MANFDRLVQRVVDVSRKAARTGTATEISIGEATHRAILAKIKPGADARARRSLRADALVVISKRLQDEGCPRVNLNRAIQVCHVARLFGADNARTLSVNSVECFCRLIKRNTVKEEWNIKPKHVDQGKALWARVTAGDVNPADVRAAVDSILGTKPRKSKPKPSPAERLTKVLAATSAEDIATALEQLQSSDRDAFRRLFQAAKSLLPPKKPRPAVDAPTVRKPLFGREKAA